jgi:hypothetical protein
MYLILVFATLNQSRLDDNGKVRVGLSLVRLLYEGVVIIGWLLVGLWRSTFVAFVFTRHYTIVLSLSMRSILRLMSDETILGMNVHEVYTNTRLTVTVVVVSGRNLYRPN